MAQAKDAVIEQQIEEAVSSAEEQVASTNSVLDSKFDPDEKLFYFDQKEARGFVISESEMVGVTLYKCCTISIRIKDPDNMEKTVEKTKSFFIDLVQSMKFHDCEFVIPKEKSGIIIYVPYTMETRKVLTTIREGVEQLNSDSCSMRLFVKNIAKIAILPEKQTGGDVFFKGFVAAARNGFVANNETGDKDQPVVYVRSRQYIDDSIGFNEREIDLFNKADLRVNKIRLYNANGNDEDGETYTIPFYKKLFIVSYEIGSSAEGEAFRLVRHAVSIRLKMKQMFAKSDYRIPIGIYVKTKTVERDINSFNEIFFDENKKFIVEDELGLEKNRMMFTLKSELKLIDSVVFNAFSKIEPTVSEPEAEQQVEQTEAESTKKSKKSSSKKNKKVSSEESTEEIEEKKEEEVACEVEVGSLIDDENENDDGCDVSESEQIGSEPVDSE